MSAVAVVFIFGGIDSMLVPALGLIRDVAVEVEFELRFRGTFETTFMSSAHLP